MSVCNESQLGDDIIAEHRDRQHTVVVEVQGRNQFKGEFASAWEAVQLRAGVESRFAGFYRGSAASE